MADLIDRTLWWMVDRKGILGDLATKILEYRGVTFNDSPDIKAWRSPATPGTPARDKIVQDETTKQSHRLAGDTQSQPELDRKRDMSDLISNHLVEFAFDKKLVRTLMKSLDTAVSDPERLSTAKRKLSIDNIAQDWVRLGVTDETAANNIKTVLTRHEPDIVAAQSRWVNELTQDDMSPKGKPVDVIDEGQWHMDVNGRIESKTSIGQSEDGFHYRTYSTDNHTFENEGSWSKAFKTRDLAEHVAIATSPDSAFWILSARRQAGIEARTKPMNTPAAAFVSQLANARYYREQADIAHAKKHIGIARGIREERMEGGLWKHADSLRQSRSAVKAREHPEEQAVQSWQAQTLDAGDQELGARRPRAHTEVKNKAPQPRP